MKVNQSNNTSMGRWDYSHGASVISQGAMQWRMGVLICIPQRRISWQRSCKVKCWGQCCGAMTQPQTWAVRDICTNKNKSHR